MVSSANDQGSELPSNTAVERPSDERILRCLKRVVAVMELQQGRMNGSFHLPSHSFVSEWESALCFARVIRDDLEQSI